MLIILPLSGFWFIGQGVYIQSKAVLAQILLESAWHKTVRGNKEVKPWPWADTWPVGRLSVPRLGISRIVLAGASGESLAFGPGHLFTMPTSETSDHTVLAGHRDTHFRFLQQLVTDDRLLLQSEDGGILEYTIVDIRILHEEDSLPFDPERSTLTLITCYPFDTIQPGGPLRLAITASMLPASPPINLSQNSARS